VIGASEKEGKVGNTVLKNIINSTYKGKIFPINPNSDKILGHQAYKSVLEVSDDIDIAIFVIPSKYVNEAAEECGEKGIKGLIVISAGFKEIGGKGIEREDKLVEISKKYDMRILGPNCLGFIGLNYNGSFAVDTPKKGNIAMISQSGAMLTGMMDYSMMQPFGFSCNISLGNKADLGAVDFIEYLADDEDTKVILCYLESIKDGDRFLEVVSKATRKKPIVILKSGVSEAGARAASSHTGALAGSDTAYDLAFKKCGVIRAKSIEDLFDFGEIFLYQPIPKKNSFAIITNAGGPGIVATDAFSREGIAFSQFNETMLHELRENLPLEAAIFNPIDIVGDAPPKRYEFTLKTVFGLNHKAKSDYDDKKEENEITTEGVLVIVTPQAQTKPLEVAKLISDITSKNLENKPVICSFIGEKSVSEARRFLKDNHIPCYHFPDKAAHSLKTLINRREFLNLTPLTAVEIPTFDVNKQRVEEIIKAVRKDERTVLLSHETAEIFDCYGIISPKSKLAKTPRQAMEMQKEIGKAVMKIVSPQIIHKTDVGGIALNIETPQDAFEAYIQIIDSVKKFAHKNVKIYGVEVQEMIDFDKEPKVNELIVGMSKDPQFGPMIMVGSGGIYANFLKDVSFALSYKFTEEDAKNTLQKTKIYSLLEGVRGESRSDIEAVIEVLLRLSQLVNDFTDIVELDINPLLALVDGYSALDIKITIER
ncbi:MAG: CoA-binding protein, partial [Candidatus Lokiarchaeota archaeon]|nr:CoA-binding protein [Candidatus Lokiarchaeota archaeon]MBD3341458.1 CoA-binding protein [Candidatus Lokiarchaeota archaeon]